jgi:hypothetical protein
MTQQGNQAGSPQSGKRVLFNILAFMLGLVILLLLIKYFMKM